MTGIGIGLIVAFYSVGLYGYCLVKGYDISYTDLWRPTKPKWPAEQLPPTQMSSTEFKKTGDKPAQGQGTFI